MLIHLQSFEAQRWHQFLLYVAYNLIAFIINSLLSKGLPIVTKSACKFLFSRRLPNLLE